MYMNLISPVNKIQDVINFLDKRCLYKIQGFFGGVDSSLNNEYPAFFCGVNFEKYTRTEVIELFPAYESFLPENIKDR